MSQRLGMLLCVFAINYDVRLKSSWTHVIRKRDLHHTSTKFRLGV